MIPIAWSPVYAHSLPEGHRFPMEKYNLLPEQLIYERSIAESQLFQPQLMDEQTLLGIHDAEYWLKLKEQRLSKQEERRTGFPLSHELLTRERVIMQGTLDAALLALEHGAAMNIAGGTHHAYRDRGEGFCLLNDIAIAAVGVLPRLDRKQILVVDLDVHQGNGTAHIFRDTPEVYTFSMHGQNNYPMHKEQSDLDVALPDGVADAEYLKLLGFHLPALIERLAPGFIFFQSGVDILDTDALGKLKVSKEGCKMRDRMVFELARKNKIPIVASMGGGYSPRIADVIEAHANTFREAMNTFS